MLFRSGWTHPDERRSCDGACLAVSATCETCLRKQDPNLRRDSLGRALAGLLASPEVHDAPEEKRDEYAEDEPDTWPSWCFRESSVLLSSRRKH